jgi:hypothetical protein
VPDFRRIQHRRSAKQREQPSLVRKQGLTINSVFDVISVFEDFLRRWDCRRLASGFRRDVSAASETYSADI